MRAGQPPSAAPRPTNRWPAALLALALAAVLVPLPARGPAAAAPAPPAGYVNPVSSTFADTFADPAVLRGKDGWWYAYGTSDPLREGEGRAHRVPIARSTDLVTWRHVADAFTDATLPSWAAPGASIWAPDVRYVDGEYRMYYVVTETTVTAEPNDNAIGMATAPTPVGPWTDSGGPVVAPRRGGVVGDGNFKWTFDPAAVTDTDGSQWLFYGSYYGGVFVTRLSADGRHAQGEPTMVAIDNKFEGAYVVRRGGFWYLFASTANCCAGPATGYSVQVGRSRDLRGPYVDRQGVRLTASRAGGTPVLVQNGNRWIGAGHNAVVTDLTGQDWIAYHAINRADPYLDGTDGINERPMLLDRLDWVGGWPAVRAGAGPSANRQRAPVVRGRQVTRFTGGIGPAWARLRGWTTAADPQSGRYARSADASALLTRSRSRGPVRVEADLRSPGHAYGLVAGSRPGGSGVSVVLDPRAGSLRLREVRSGRVVGAARAALPAGFRPGEWHNLALELRGRTALAHLTHARLGDPVAAVTLRLRSRDAASGRAGALTGGAGVGLDNLSVLPASVPVTRLVPDPPPGRLDTARSDEFSGPVLRPGWTWVRPDPAAAVQGGMLRWPTQAADLVGTVNDAAVLLRDPGPGSWTAQTKVTIDLGTDTIRNFQQAGLVAYVGDDQFARLSHVAIWNTRQTEFGHELPFAGRLAFGGTIVGPPAATTWLRLTHRLDSRNREHELRAWTSRDGRTWVKGGVWTLPAAGTLRVGLVSHGGAGATAQFAYLRIFRG